MFEIKVCPRCGKSVSLKADCDECGANKPIRVFPCSADGSAITPPKYCDTCPVMTGRCYCGYKFS